MKEPLVSRLCAGAYRFFAVRRPLLFSGVFLLVALSAVGAGRLRIEEDIAALLPDDRSDAALDFSLISQAPLSRRTVITVRADAGVGQGELLAAVDRLAAALGPPGFSAVTTGPGAGAGERGRGALGDALPNLFTAGDRALASASLTREGVRGRLAAARERLLSPGGFAFKETIREDPLELGALAAAKLRALGVVPGMRIVEGRFLSADGRSALIMAETPVGITDSAGARALLAQFEAAARAALPAGIVAELVGGHRYALANADAIRGDLVRVIGISSLAVLAIYLLFLRSRWALFVFLVPSTVLLVTTALASVAWGKVFAVTVGFGAVLLGLADEYAMHLYFALRRGGAPPAATVGAVARPVLFGGLATAAAFGVMLFSSLPGQRQLAAYAVTGIVVSLLVSLVVLPHLVPPERRGGGDPPPAHPPARRRPRRGVVIVWVLGLAWSGWQATHLVFNGDLRAMNLVPADLQRAERSLRETWGDPRGRAMVFATGPDLERALELNDRLFAWLEGRVPPEAVASLAPVLPAASTQRENRQRWRSFWEGSRADELRDLLATEGKPLGFSARAFDPFLERIGREAAPVTRAGLTAAGFGAAVDALVLEQDGTVRVLTLVPDTPAVAALFAGPGAGPPAGVRFVSPGGFNRTVSRTIAREFARYVLLTSLLVVLLVAFLFRRPGPVLLALLPAVSGLLFMCGGMGALGLEFNLFNIVATVLIIGLCVDYGIFVVSNLAGGADRAADRAVLVSGLTTLSGFGSLVLARHPSLHSIGVTVLLGIGAALPVALLVLPALFAAGTERRGRGECGTLRP